MIAGVVVRFFYQPIADFAAKRSLMSCYQLGQQCAIGCATAWIGREAVNVENGYESHEYSLCAFAAMSVPLWCLLMFWRYRECQALHNAMMASKPCAAPPGVAAGWYMWMPLLAFDLASVCVLRNINSSLSVVVDIFYLSIYSFMMCVPMRPRPKPAKAPVSAVMELT
jgi:hypothetical protein